MGFSLSNLGDLLSDGLDDLGGISKAVQNYNSTIKKYTGSTSIFPSMDSGTAATTKQSGGFLSGDVLSLNGVGALGGYGTSTTSSATTDAATHTTGAPSVQSQLVGAQSGAFKWVEQYVSPSMFATAESCLLGYGLPIKSANSAGSNFNLLGFCQDVSINVGASVVTFKELRCEHTRVIPTKSTPGSITITRVLGNMPDFLSAVIGGSGWKFNSQAVDFKQLFGLAIVFMTSGRTKTLSTLYAERCAIQNISIPIQAGNFQLVQNITIVFDKLIDDTVPVFKNAQSATAADLDTTYNTTGITGNETSTTVPTATTGGTKTRADSTTATNPVTDANAAGKATTTIGGPGAMATNTEGKTV